jgi:peptidoglycan/xylan/chitin deacetylase (PgdA/CDA1 family)
MILLKSGPLAASLLLFLGLSLPASASLLVEPRLTIPPGRHHGSHVALTLDACSGNADERIIRALISHRIEATFFVTARWLHRNSEALAELKAHPELFEIENHGGRHVPAIDRPMRIFGIAAAGSPGAVRTEVETGAAAVMAATGHKPMWFRGATAEYTTTSLALIQAMGAGVAGFSISADEGALLDAETTAKRIERARDGDVILAHVNQPSRSAGLGVVEGVLALEARGYRFMRLEDAIPDPVPHGPALTH